MMEEPSSDQAVSETALSRPAMLAGAGGAAGVWVADHGFDLRGLDPMI